MTNTFSVVLSGSVLPGFDRHEALVSFAALIKRDLAFAKRLVTGNPIAIKSGLPEVTARKYVTALQKIGICADVENRPAMPDLKDAVDDQYGANVDAVHQSRDAMTEGPPTADSQSRFEAVREKKSRPALWNPDAAANWSFLFSPVLGAYLQMLNWEALGEHAEARQARGWLFISLIFTAPAIWIATLVARGSMSTGWLGLPIVYLFVWYFAASRPQVGYVRSALPDGYEHKPWLVVLSVALLVSVLFNFVSSAVIAASLSSAKSSATSQNAFKNNSSPRKPDVEAAAAFDPLTARATASDASQQPNVGSQRPNPLDDPNFGKTESNPFLDPNSGKESTSPPTGLKENTQSLTRAEEFRLSCKFQGEDGSINERILSVDEAHRTVDGIAVALFDDEKIVYDLPKIDGLRNIVVIDRSTGSLTVTHMSATVGPQPIALRAACTKVPMKMF